MKKIHYAWAVLVSCCALVLGIGFTINAIGQFFVPVTKDLGLGMGDFTFYYALRGVSLVISTTILNKWIAKFDVRLLTSVCFAIIVLCIGLMSTFSKVWQWYIAGVIMGFVSPPVYFQMPSIILSNWFEKKRGFVIGIAMAFSGVGGFIMNPIVASLIQSYGWRFAYVANAVISAVIVLPFLMFVIRMRPEDKGLKPYGYEEKAAVAAGDGSGDADSSAIMVKGAMKEDVIRTFPFFVMVVMLAVNGFFSGYPQHLTSYGLSIGVASTLASFLLSLNMIGNATSKLLLGFVSDKFGGKAMISTSFSMILISFIMLLFGAKYLPALVIGALFSGTMYSVSSVASPLLVQTVFGNRDFARIFLVLILSQNLFVSLGPSIVGYMFDFSGGYTIPYYFGIALVAIAAFMVFYSIRSSKKLKWS